jgi:hypothetical protein
MMGKNDIELVESWTENHSKYCSQIWSVDFQFDHYDAEVKCFYVKDFRLKNREKLEYRHLFDLEEKVQKKYGKRYRVGILFEDIPPEEV